MKHCCRCKRDLLPEAFGIRRSTKDGRDYTCRECVNAAAREWHKLHKDRANILQKRCHLKVRMRCLEFYGGVPPKCACCKESTIQFLGIDHVNGGGTKHKKEIGWGGNHLYYWLIRNKFPQGFQVLCYNCNMAKGFYGKCPHQEGKDGC